MAFHSLVKPYAPSRERSVEAIDHAAARLAWARGLSEMDLRALAGDYLMGAHDESGEDAFREFCRRWPDEGEKAKARVIKQQEAARKRAEALAAQSMNDAGAAQ